MTTVGSSYTQNPIADQWDAIVIGSGIGGLTTAALLARHAGKRVLVLERHYVAGGFTHAFHRPGYEWDVGVHYVGQLQNPASPVRAALDHLTEGRLEWSAMPEVYDRVFIAGREYQFVAGLERFRDQMKSYFPREHVAIDRYLRAVQSCVRTAPLYFTEKALPRPLARLAGGLLRAPFLRWARRTTAEVLAEFTGNRELIGVLTAQWGDYGLPPARSSFAAHAMIAAHYLEGASYPVGGAPSIAAAIAPTIEAAGGRIVFNAEVSQVLLDRERRAAGVRMKDGRELRASTVISDAGAPNTFGSLLPPEAPGVVSPPSKNSAPSRHPRRTCASTQASVKAPASLASAEPISGSTQPRSTTPTSRVSTPTHRRHSRSCLSRSPRPRTRISSAAIPAAPRSKSSSLRPTSGSANGKTPRGSAAARSMTTSSSAWPSACAAAWRSMCPRCAANSTLPSCPRRSPPATS